MKLRRTHKKKKLWRPFAGKVQTNGQQNYFGVKEVCKNSNLGGKKVIFKIVYVWTTLRPFYIQKGNRRKISMGIKMLLAQEQMI